MTRRVSATLFAGCVFIAAPCAAQTPGSFVDPARGISLDQAIARARAEEPSLRAAKAAIDVARGVRLQAGLRRSPSLSAELRKVPATTDSQTMIGVEWPLELYRRDGRLAVADQELTAAEFSVADQERLLVAEVRARFGEALATVRDLALVDELLDASRQQHGLLQARVEQGASAPIERDLADVELRRLSAERSLQLGRVERAMFQLRRILGAPPNEPLFLRDSLEDVVERESTTVLASRDAVERRADVREATARVAAADARIDRADREGKLDVTLFGGYMRMDMGFSQLGLSSTGMAEPVRGVFHYAAAGAAVTLPLFNRNQGDVAVARAERAGAAALQQAATLTAQTEIEATKAMDQRAHEAAQVYAGAARALARQNLSVVRQSYELGRTTIFEVLTEQKRYLDFERAYTDTLRAAYDARTNLNRALGETR